MKAAQLTKPEQFKIVQVPVPSPGDDEVLVKVVSCGVCRGDFNKWSGLSEEYPRPPGSPGHEVLGFIETLGSKIDNFEKGQTVAVIGFPGKGYAEFTCVKARHALVVPESLKDQTILGEPLACAVNAVRRAAPLPGDSVLVLGVGFMGALAIKVLITMGTSPLIAADIRPEGRALAERLGADIVLNPEDGDFFDNINGASNGDGVDFVFEATGVQNALDLASDAVKIKGTLVIYGYHVGAPRTVDMQLWNWKGINVINAHERDSDRYFQGMERGFNLLRYNKIRFDLVSHEFTLDRINECFAMIQERPPDYIKAIIRP